MEGKVYTETCHHVYCKPCLTKWYTKNPTCRFDKIKLENVFVFNLIEAKVDFVAIMKVISEYICRERENDFKLLSEVIIKILSRYMENYNHLISISNVLKDIYEIFPDNYFQMLLDMDPKHSSKEFNKFMTLIDSVGLNFFYKLENLRITIVDYAGIITNKKEIINWCMKTCGDLLQFDSYIIDLILFLKVLLRLQYQKKINCFD